MGLVDRNKLIDALFHILKGRAPTEEETIFLLSRYDNSPVDDVDLPSDGVNGESAYEVWLGQGNSGTEQDFLVSLVGADGQDGIGLPASADIGDIVVFDGLSWISQPQPIEEFLESGLLVNQQLPAGTAYRNIIAYDTPDINTLTGGTFNNFTGVFTCTEAGIFRFDFHTTLDQYDGNNRTSARVRLALNGALVRGTEQIGYHRQDLHGFDNYSITKSLNLSVGDEVIVQARNEDGSRDHQLLSNSTLFRITKIKQ